MIDVATGKIKITSPKMTIDRDTSKSALINQEHGLKLNQSHGEFSSYYFQGKGEDNYRFAFHVYYKGEMIWLIALFLEDWPHYLGNISLDSRSEWYRQWLINEIGTEAGTYSWGTVSCGSDPYTGREQIYIRYRNPH